MPLTQLRHRKPNAYTVIPSTNTTPHPRYYAFHHLATGLLATIYANDGNHLADRATLPLPTAPPTAENGLVIPSTFSEHAPSPATRGRAGVGAGALAWRTAPNELTVWDVASSSPSSSSSGTTTATLHTYQTTAATYCSPPAYHDAHLLWIEFPDHEEEPNTGHATFTLRRAACDLTDPETLATVLFTTPVQSWTLSPEARIATSPETLLFETSWADDINHEVHRAAGARFPLPPTSLAPTSQDGAALDLLQGFPSADGTALGIGIATRTLQAHDLTLGAPSVPRWPTTGPWELSTEPGLVYNAAVTADGTTALLYAYPLEGATPLVLEAPTTANHAADTEPAARVAIASHPIHGTPPDLLFFLEP